MASSDDSRNIMDSGPQKDVGVVASVRWPYFSSAIVVWLPVLLLFFEDLESSVVRPVVVVAFSMQLILLTYARRVSKVLTIQLAICLSVLVVRGLVQPSSPAAVFVAGFAGLILAFGQLLLINSKASASDNKNGADLVLIALASIPLLTLVTERHFTALWKV